MEAFTSKVARGPGSALTAHKRARAPPLQLSPRRAHTATQHTRRMKPHSPKDGELANDVDDTGRPDKQCH
eukprot:scaffold104667_cov72-Phaeocystis_antarctica.AAC.14